MRIVLYLFGVLSSLGMTAGCAISNEGASDYRYIPPGNVSTSRDKYLAPKDATHFVAAGAPLVVSLKHAFIKEFTEWRTPLRLIRREPPNAEFAVVVNAFEKHKAILDLGPKGLDNARVVHFSDDVWEGQHLNFSNLATIYGPLKYEGKPFIIDLYGVELDIPGEQL